MGRLLALALLVVGAVAGAAVLDSPAAENATTSAVQMSVPLQHARTFRLPAGTTHIAFHWRSRPGARVRYSLSRDGHHFSRARLVQADDAGEMRRGETYGALIVASDAHAVRVESDRPLRRLTLLELADHGPSPRALARLRQTAGTYPQPSVISRAGWGADESLRFDTSGKEIWPPAFYPVQKVIVHHTATQNVDPDPAATIRSIYYYHAVTQGWGDIGYNFLIDEAGRIYEGRHSRTYAPGESPTGEDPSGNGVTGAHALGYNSGTVGIALLGTLTNQDATPAARSALERLIAWIDSSHGIDPQGAALYTNPVSGLQATFPNIAGHRDVGATECPGGTFYATLPTIRSNVAALISGGAPDFSLAVTPSGRSIYRGSSTTYTVSVGSQYGFSDSVSFTLSGLPRGTGAAFTPASVVGSGSSTLKVATTGKAPRGTFVLTVMGTSATLTHSATTTLTLK